jgi:hypothetical protein
MRVQPFATATMMVIGTNYSSVRGVAARPLAIYYHGNPGWAGSIKFAIGSRAHQAVWRRVLVARFRNDGGNYIKPPPPTRVLCAMVVILILIGPC